MNGEANKDLLTDQQIDWSRLDRAYYLALKDENDRRSNEIKLQLDDARRVFASGGAPSDTSWMKRAEYALMCSKRLSQQLQNRISEIRSENHMRTKEVEHAKKISWERGFVRVARRVLTGAQFDEIAKAAETEQA